MEKLKHKLKGHGGFTLVEMLVVVAIIAILVAVSIPLVSNALERTKHATDAANERAAKAEILVQYLAGDDEGSATVKAGDIYYYNAALGKIQTGSANIVGYGKHDRTEADHKDKIIVLRIHPGGATDAEKAKKDEVQMKWVAEADSATKAEDTDWNTKLCSITKKVDHSS